MNHISKQEIAEALVKAGVHFPPTATLGQLKKLLMQIIGAPEKTLVSATAEPEEINPESCAEIENIIRTGCFAAEDVIAAATSASRAVQQTTNTEEDCTSAAAAKSTVITDTAVMSANAITFKNGAAAANNAVAVRTVPQSVTITVAASDAANNADVITKFAAAHTLPRNAAISTVARSDAAANSTTAVNACALPESACRSATSAAITNAAANITAVEAYALPQSACYYSATSAAASNNADIGDKFAAAHTLPRNTAIFTAARSDAAANSATAVDACTLPENACRSAASAATSNAAVNNADATNKFATTAARSDATVNYATAANNVTAASNAVDEDLKMLRKKLEVLQLQQQINELENRQSILVKERTINFADIEHAITKFSGDDTAHSVHCFFRDFEEIMCSTNADENFKLLSLRRSLTGTARVFLSMTTALNYAELKRALIAEFDFAVSRQDVYRMMRQRRWNKKGESLHRYVLNMQAIAMRSDISEMEVVDFIIDGIGNSVSNVGLLVGARSINELKLLINRYQQKYLDRAAPSRDASTPMKQTPSAQGGIQDERVLCYNCSQRGHMKPQCPYPIRPNGSCFRCWEMGHDHRACPNPKKTLVQTAAARRSIHPVAAAVDFETEETHTTISNFNYHN